MQVCNLHVLGMLHLEQYRNMLSKVTICAWPGICH